MSLRTTVVVRLTRIPEEVDEHEGGHDPIHPRVHRPGMRVLDDARTIRVVKGLSSGSDPSTVVARDFLFDHAWLSRSLQPFEVEHAEMFAALGNKAVEACLKGNSLYGYFLHHPVPHSVLKS